MEIFYEKLVVDENSFFHYDNSLVPRFPSPFHQHDEFELILILESYGKLYIGNSVTNFNSGQLYFFAPRLPHCFFNAPGYEKGNELAHSVVIQFKRDFLGNSFFEKTEASQLKKLIKKSEFGVQILNPSELLQERMQTLNQKRDLEKLGEFIFILNDIATNKNVKLLNEENSVNFSSLNDSKIINDVYKYVAENFQKGISFIDAASIANMQKAAFCRYFKRKTQKRFTKFVNETRIMHARKLLEETDKTIFEIAFESGYENISYFNRQFKLLCNISPTAFREQFNKL